MIKSVLQTNYLAVIIAVVDAFSLQLSPAGDLSSMFFPHLVTAFLLVRFVLFILPYNWRGLRLGIWGVGWVSSDTSKITEFSKKNL